MAPPFHQYAMSFLHKTQKIDTNILLANRQTFAEAKEIILRRARLVKVTTTNIDLSRRLCASQLSLLDPKYSNLCIMTHNLYHHYRGNSNCPPKSEFVLYGRDVETFCRAIMGDTALSLRPQVCAATRHTLAFTTNFHHENVAPEYLSREKIHEQVLQPYRKRLHGFFSVSLQGSCVGLGEALAATAVKDMKSKFIPDPDELLNDIEDLLLLSQKGIGGYWHSIIPIYKALDMCKGIVRDPDVWAGVKNKASDRTAFVNDILGKTYRSLLEQLVIWSKFSPLVRSDVPYTAYLMQMYEMSLAAARWFGAPGWSPPTRLEMDMHHCVAREIFVHNGTRFTVRPLGVGYKAAQRALELAPGRENFKPLVELYENCKERFVQLGYFIDIDDDVLIENGIAWWSGSQPWSYT
ncbi:hypothetical protein INS49_009065 [Diaporthe citri]|uniref:uncharacterized protein n=1 Tax=Diaporthe citri TaxID=83186 RepID=UPI001C7E624C|nr:uncharacterized protein INS49_009065 [Diaporthe citri]KAG6363962.1 hypothetical protein INS49_009065 [Diaporthe citri]